MARRRVKDRKRRDVGRCKHHPEREAVFNKNGQSTGMCSECLQHFGKRGAVDRWKKPEAEAAALTEKDPRTEIAERLAAAVLEMARPGAEQTVLTLLLQDVRARAGALLAVMARGLAA